jgi:transcriptional regulator with XRE-family HTH domain
MTTGEKIKYFRNMRGISQETLGQLSGINSATIKKYEYGIRNPKSDQLLKIANALGISINIFMDFDIETVSDVLSLLFKLDDQIDMKFEADKDDAISSQLLLSCPLKTISSTKSSAPI